MRAMNEAGEGRWWISRKPGTTGVSPFPGSHRELVVIAPQSIFNCSLCIITLKKESAGNLKLPLLPCWDEELLSQKGAEISWQENFQPPGQQWGENLRISCPPKQSMSHCHSSGAHCEQLQFLTLNLLKCFSLSFPIDSHARQFQFPTFKPLYVG